MISLGLSLETQTPVLLLSVLAFRHWFDNLMPQVGPVVPHTLYITFIVKKNHHYLNLDLSEGLNIETLLVHLGSLHNKGSSCTNTRFPIP